MKIFRDLILLMLLFGGIYAAFYFINFQPEKTSLEFPIEKEEQLGELLIENFMESNEVIDDSLVNAAIAIIADRLLSGIDSTAYDYKIKVVKSDEINAFATLGGNLVILSGLIEFTESAEELATILAHEIGHVEERHVVDKLLTELGLTVLLNVLTGGEGLILSDIAKLITSSAFSRTQEKEADEFALDLLSKTEINPHLFGTVFRRLDDELGGYDKNLEFLMSHPHNKARIRAAFEYEIPEGFEELPFELNWSRVQEAITDESADPFSL